MLATNIRYAHKRQYIANIIFVFCIEMQNRVFGLKIVLQLELLSSIQQCGKLWISRPVINDRRSDDDKEV